MRSILLASLAMLGAVPSMAQVATPSPVNAPPEADVLVASTEKHLWAALVESRDQATTTRLALRDKFSPFVSRAPLKGALKLMAARGDELFAFFGDDATCSFYRMTVDGLPAIAERQLPDGAAPLTIAASDKGLYAVVSSGVAAATSQPTAASKSLAEPAEFQPDASPLSVVLYGRLGWQPVIACPSEVTADSNPALCAVPDGLLLFWIAADHGGIRAAALSGDAPMRWIEYATIAAASPTAFWPAQMDGILTVTVVSDGDKPELGLFQRIGATWSRAALTFDGAAPDPRREEIREAVAFNQNLCLVVGDRHGDHELRFGRVNGRPTQKTLSTSDVFAPPAPKPQMQIHTFMFLVLIATFAAIWIFRRASMVAPVALPDGVEPAFVSQRVLAWLIDLLPFTLAFAAILNVDWTASLGELVKWAIEGDAEGGSIARPEVIRWWILSGSSYLIYSTLLELAGRRTIGKVIMRIRLMAETGRRATLGQVLVRNVFRVLELTPPLWALNFPAVLTRNRQRLGDLFARTVVVRHKPGPRSADIADDSDDDDSRPNDDSPPAGLS